MGSETKLRLLDSGIDGGLGFSPASAWVLRCLPDDPLDQLEFEAAARQLFGLPQQDAAEAARCLGAAIHPGDLARLKDVKRRLVEHGAAEITLRWRHPNGHYRRMLTHLELAMGPDGRPREIVGFVMTPGGRTMPRTRAGGGASRAVPSPSEKALVSERSGARATATDLLWTVLQSASLPMCLTDRGGRLERVSAAFASFCGGSREAFPSIHTWAERHLVEQESWPALWEGAVGRHPEAVVTSTLRGLHLKGPGDSLRDLQLRLHVTPGAVLVVFEDVTASKRATGQLTDPDGPAAAFSALHVSHPIYPYPLIHFTESVHTLTGFPAGYFLDNNNPWYERIHPEDLPKVAEGIAMLVCTGRLIISYRWLHADGRHRRLWADSRLLRDAEGKPLEMFGCHADIDALGGEAAAARACEQRIDEYMARRTESLLREHESLKRSAEPLRLLVEQSPVPMAIIRFDGTFEYLNSTFTRHFGHPPDAAHDVDGWVRLLLPCDREAALQHWQHEVLPRALAGQPIPSSVWTFETASGDVRSIQLQAAAIEGRLLVVYEDVTALRTAENRLLRLMRHTSSTLIELSPEGRVLHTNERAAAPPVDQALKELGWGPELEQAFAECAESLQEVSRTHSCADCFGAERHYFVTFSPVVEAGRLRSVVVTCTDITRQTLNALRLERQRQELARLTHLSSLGEVTAAFAHELAQPLSALVGNISAALSAARACLHHTCGNEVIFEDILCNVSRLRAVFERVRDLASPTRFKREGCSPTQLVEDVVRLAEAEAAARKVKLCFHPAPDLPELWLDPVHMQQVLLNLLMNAFDAVSDLPQARRRVEIATGSVPGGGVSIEVSDQGCGLAPEVLPQLFTQPITTKPHGTGIGLRLCLRLVEMHGGTITARNNPRHGATFRIQLPPGKEADA